MLRAEAALSACGSCGREGSCRAFRTVCEVRIEPGQSSSARRDELERVRTGSDEQPVMRGPRLHTWYMRRAKGHNRPVAGAMIESGPAEPRYFRQSLYCALPLARRPTGT